VQVATTTASAYTDGGLQAGTTYSYTVTAVDAAGNESARSAPASATPTGDVTAPAAPAGLSATAGQLSVALDWADNAEPDLASYRVYRDGVGVATTTASSYADTGLTAGVTYTYRVTAVDRSGNESAVSNAASATPRAAPVTATFAPDSLSVVSGGVDAGSLASLAADDGDRLHVSGLPRAEFVASRTLPAGAAETLSRLRIEFDGHTAHHRDDVTLLVFDWAAGTWRILYGPTSGLRSDTRRGFELADPRRYVSPGGQVRLAVRSEHRQGSTIRADLVSFTVEY